MFKYEDLIRLTNRYTPPLNPETYFREMGLLDDIPLPILGYTYEGYPLSPPYVLEERPPSSSPASSGTPSPLPSAYVPRQQNAFPSWSPPPPYESEERPLSSPESPPPPYEPEERPLPPESPYELDTMFVEDDDEEDTSAIIIDDEEDTDTSAIIIDDDEEDTSAIIIDDDDIELISYQPPRPSVIQYASRVF